MDETLTSRVEAAVALHAPGATIRIGNRSDKATWSISFADGTQTDQETAAAAALAEFDILGDLKSRLKQRIDADAEVIRLRYITPGAGMAMTYQEKFAQAQAVNAFGQEYANALTQQEREASFPTLSASVGLEAATLWDCAQLVIQKYAQFATLSKVIEGTRLAGKKAISDAADEAAARAACEAITWPT